MWNEKDAVNLREFLSSETGKNLIDEFENFSPPLSGDTVDERAMAASAYAQWLRDKHFVKQHRDTKEDPTLTRNKTIDVTQLD